MSWLCNCLFMPRSEKPRFDIVGLPDASVKEAKERVWAAIKNSGYEFPNKVITVNLAPADVKKEGGHLDLAIAVAVLKCGNAGLIRDVVGTAFLGELSLEGGVRPFPAYSRWCFRQKKRG